MLNISFFIVFIISIRTDNFYDFLNLGVDLNFNQPTSLFLPLAFLTQKATKRAQIPQNYRTNEKLLGKEKITQSSKIPPISRYYRNKPVNGVGYKPR